MRELEMLDSFGVPEFFATTVGRVEPAGGGCVRAYLCVEKGGVLVVQYTVVMPAMNMAEAAKAVQEGVRDIYSMERISVVPAH